MPELPEVETIARGLDQKIRGRKIVDSWTDWPKYAPLRKRVIGKKIIDVSRRAKNILIRLSDNHLLLVHQKMSGHLMVGKWEKQNETWLPDPPTGPLADPQNRFIRLIFFLDNGQMLALSDLRRFAKVLCGPQETILNLPDLKDLGPEPLDPKFAFGKFKELFHDKKGRIKQVLMDPNFISGIGNIYADEILWFSKIHPLARTEKLKEKDLRAIYRAMRLILKKALKYRGTSIDDYRDAEGRRGSYDKVRYVYQREGESCPRCQTKVKRMKIGGRSAHYCPKCQTLK